MLTELVAIAGATQLTVEVRLSPQQTMMLHELLLRVTNAPAATPG